MIYVCVITLVSALYHLPASVHWQHQENTRLLQTSISLMKVVNTTGLVSLFKTWQNLIENGETDVEYTVNNY